MNMPFPNWPGGPMLPSIDPGMYLDMMQNQYDVATGGFRPPKIPGNRPPMMPGEWPPMPSMPPMPPRPPYPPVQGSPPRPYEDTGPPTRPDLFPPTTGPTGTAPGGGGTGGGDSPFYRPPNRLNVPIDIKINRNPDFGNWPGNMRSPTRIPGGPLKPSPLQAPNFPGGMDDPLPTFPNTAPLGTGGEAKLPFPGGPSNPLPIPKSPPRPNGGGMFPPPPPTIQPPPPIIEPPPPGGRMEPSPIPPAPYPGQRNKEREILNAPPLHNQRPFLWDASDEWPGSPPTPFAGGGPKPQGMLPPPPPSQRGNNQGGGGIPPGAIVDPPFSGGGRKAGGGGEDAGGVLPFGHGRNVGSGPAPNFGTDASMPAGGGSRPQGSIMPGFRPDGRGGYTNRPRVPGTYAGQVSGRHQTPRGGGSSFDTGGLDANPGRGTYSPRSPGMPTPRTSNVYRNTYNRGPTTNAMTFNQGNTSNVMSNQYTQQGPRLARSMGRVGGFDPMMYGGRSQQIGGLRNLMQMLSAMRGGRR